MKHFAKTLFALLLVCMQFACYGEETKVFLVYGGKNGWIGQKIVTLLKEQRQIVYAAEARLENRCDVDAEILRLNPDYIINCAGVTGTPNVDWCETHQQETIRATYHRHIDISRCSLSAWHPFDKFWHRLHL